MLKLIPWRLVAACFGVLVAVAALCLYAVEISRQPSLSYFIDAPIGGDFLQFWSAARLTLFGDPSAPFTAEGITAMVRVVRYLPPFAMNSPLYYPPMYLFMIAPFGVFDYTPSLFVFFFTTLGLFLAAIYCITRSVWFTLFMLCFMGIWLNLVTGQNGMLTASLYGFALLALSKRGTGSGVLFGLLSFKPHLGLLVPFCLIAGRYGRAFLFAALTAIGFAMLALIVFGPETWINSLHGTLLANINLSTREYLLSRIPSLYASLRLLHIAPGQAMLLHWALVSPIILATLWAWRVSRNDDLRAGLLLCGTLLALPFLYDYDMASLGIVLAFFFRELKRNGWWPMDYVIFPLVLVWPIMVNHITAMTPFQLGLVGPLLMYLTLLRRVVAERRAEKSGAQALAA